MISLAPNSVGSRIVNPRTALVDIHFVRALHGVSTLTVEEWVDSGKILWAFDLSLKKNKRQLRFWNVEICRSENISGLTLKQVVKRILPESRVNFRTTEISQLFLLSKAQGYRFGVKFGNRSAMLSSRDPILAPRRALATFLHSRWVGRGTSS
ncbi:MAG: hypothetical protein U1F65_05125 [Verrucomicrobiota bacterium]